MVSRMAVLGMQLLVLMLLGKVIYLVCNMLMRTVALGIMSILLLAACHLPFENISLLTKVTCRSDSR